MPATRSRTSTEQPAEVAAEEVKQVQAEDGTDIVAPVPVPAEIVKAVAAEAAAVVPESAVQPDEQPAAEPVVPAAVPADVVTQNGSAEPVAETNGSSETATNGSAVVTNGSVAEVAAAVTDESVPVEAVASADPVPVTDGSQKRKSEVGDGDVVPDSTDVKKQKVVSEGEPAAAVVAEEAAVEATA